MSNLTRHLGLKPKLKPWVSFLIYIYVIFSVAFFLGGCARGNVAYSKENGCMLQSTQAFDFITLAFPTTIIGVKLGCFMEKLAATKTEVRNF